jgi:hypothetical protein
MLSSKKTIRRDLVGGLTDGLDRAGRIAAHAEKTPKALSDKLATIALEKRRRVYARRGPDGLETRFSGSTIIAIVEAMGATSMAAASQRRNLPGHRRKLSRRTEPAQLDNPRRSTHSR